MMLDSSSFCSECHQPLAGTDRAFYQVGRVYLYPITHRVFVFKHGMRREANKRVEVHLTSQEFALLEVLMRRPGVPFPTVVLADRIGTEVEDYDQLIRTLVCRIRKAIGSAVTIEAIGGSAHAYRIVPAIVIAANCEG